MREYLIVRNDGEDNWFDITSSNYAEILHPNSMPWEQVEGWGNFRIVVDGCEISFSDEISGIQMIVEGDSLPEEVTQIIANEVLGNLLLILGQTGEVIQTQE